MSTPNLLTTTRIVLAPAVLLLVMAADASSSFGYSALAVFLAAAATDWLDGLVARRSGQVTTFGQAYDPLADKVLVGCGLLALLYIDAIELWMVIVLTAREVLVTALRALIHASGSALPASSLGKMKMCLQVAGIALLLAAVNVRDLALFGESALWMAVLVSLVSAFDYTRTCLKVHGRFLWGEAMVPSNGTPKNSLD